MIKVIASEIVIKPCVFSLFFILLKRVDGSMDDT